MVAPKAALRTEPERRRSTCTANAGSAARPSTSGRCGLENSDARRLRALEDENAKPKKFLAETMLDDAILNVWRSVPIKPRCGIGAVGKDTAVPRLGELAPARRRFGYRRLHILLAREGVRPLYHEERLRVRPLAQGPNQRCSLDSLPDAMIDSRRFRMLAIVETSGANAWPGRRQLAARACGLCASSIPRSRFAVARR